MVLTFGSQRPQTSDPALPTAADWDVMQAMDEQVRRYAESVQQARDLRDRKRRLEAKLDDPALRDHPDWGEAWNRTVRMTGEIEELESRAANALAGLRANERRLSPGATVYVQRVWSNGLRRGIAGVSYVETKVERGERVAPLEPPF